MHASWAFFILIVEWMKGKEKGSARPQAEPSQGGGLARKKIKSILSSFELTSRLINSANLGQKDTRIATESRSEVKSSWEIVENGEN